MGGLSGLGYRPGACLACGLMTDALEQLRENRPALEEWLEGLAKARAVMAELVVDAWSEGATLREVAAVSGYSHQRVHQIVRTAARDTARTLAPQTSVGGAEVA